MSQKHYELKLETPVRAASREELSEALHQLADCVKEGWNGGPVFAELNKDLTPVKLGAFLITEEAK
jgi:hypothetical protein